MIARRENLTTAAVLATVAVDRLIDGVVFTAFVPVALVLVVFPDPTGAIRSGLGWGAAGSLLVFVMLLMALAGFRLQALRDEGWLVRCISCLPVRLGEPARRLGRSFANGVVWPRETWRRIGVLLASVVIKLIAATHLLWAGLAVGIQLQPAELLVFLGFLHVIARFAHVLAGFTVGAVFALGLLGVAEEKALAMVLVVQISALLTITTTGAFTL